MNDLIVQLLNGLVVGLSLAMVASGLALVFGVLDIVNFAQGELFMLGGYALLFTLERTGNFVLGLVVAAVVVGVLGGVVLQGMVWPLLDRSTVLSLLATLGLSLIIRQLAINIFGGTTRRIPTPITSQVPVGGLDYPVYNLSIVVAGGMGNFRGAALVSLLLGEVESVGSIWFRPVEVQVFALGLVILILAARSRGKTTATPVHQVARTTARRSSRSLIEPGYGVLTAVLLVLAV